MKTSKRCWNASRSMYVFETEFIQLRIVRETKHLYYFRNIICLFFFFAFWFAFTTFTPAKIGHNLAHNNKNIFPFHTHNHNLKKKNTKSGRIRNHRINWQLERALMLVITNERWKNCTFSKTNCSLRSRIVKKNYRKKLTPYANTWVFLNFFFLLISHNFIINLFFSCDFKLFSMNSVFFAKIQCEN